MTPFLKIYTLSAMLLADTAAKDKRTQSHSETHISRSSNFHYVEKLHKALKARLTLLNTMFSHGALLTGRSRFQKWDYSRKPQKDIRLKFIINNVARLEVLRETPMPTLFTPFATIRQKKNPTKRIDDFFLTRHEERC